MKYAFSIRGTDYIMSPCNLLIQANNEVANSLALELATSIVLHPEPITMVFCLEDMPIDALSSFFNPTLGWLNATISGVSEEETYGEFITVLSARIALFQKAGVDDIMEYREFVDKDVPTIFYFLSTKNMDIAKHASSFTFWNSIASILGIYLIVLSNDDSLARNFANKVIVDENIYTMATVPITVVS